MMRRVWSLIGLLALALPVAAQTAVPVIVQPTMTAVPVIAQPVVVPTVNPNPVPVVLPPSAYVEGVGMVWQDLNRCSAASFTIQLSAYDEFTGDYTTVVRRLNPDIGDVSVRVEEMITMAEEYGLKGIVRRGGTIELMKQFLAAGFPVLIENSYYEGAGGFDDWMSHNRVLVGYDDATGEFLIKDSLLGNGEDTRGIRRKYEEIDERWRDFNRDYVVIYRPSQEASVYAILGPQVDPMYNAEWVLQQADMDAAAGHRDSFTTYNRGWAYLELGRIDEAVAAFDQARTTGLPWRFFWYDFSAFEAYMKVGRYDDVIALAQKVISKIKGVEEVYYYAGLAYLAQGNTERGKANLEAAVARNKFFTEAQSKLDELNGVTTTTTGG
jgi:tetratricopeptide (TPR) repeat protein